VELLDALNDRIDLVLRRQESDTEVICTVTLTEARTRNHTDTSTLQKLESIEGIRRQFSSLCSLDGLGGQNDTREEVHCTRRLGASEALEGVDSSAQLEGTTLERLDDVVLLLLIELIRGLSGLGRIDHAVHDDLTHSVGAESDGHHLVQLSVDLREEVVQLEVTTTVTTLAKEALGDGVEAGDLNALPDVITHVVSDLTEADKLGTVIIEVLLIHLISKENKATLDAETDDFLHALNAEDITSWVIGVDDNQSAAFNILSSGLLISTLKLRDLQGPAVFFVQSIANLHTVVKSEQRGVKRILRRGSHDTDLLILTDEEGKHVTNTSGSTISAIDGLRITGEAITSSDELCNMLTDDMVTLAVGVGASEEAVVKQELGTSDSIRSKGLRSLLHEFRALHKSTHLPDEGHGLLLELLWVANVAISHVIERKTRGNALALSVKKLHLQLVSTNSDNATHFVLCNEHTRVDCIATDNMNVISHFLIYNNINSKPTVLTTYLHYKEGKLEG